MAKMGVNLLMVLIFFAVSGEESCPRNCFCGREVTECSLDSCEDPIYLGFSVKLEVVGQLCPKQLKLLQKISHHFGVIFLEEECFGIQNCK